MTGKFRSLQATDGGTFDAYVAMPKPVQTPAPGLILFCEVLGITDWVKETVNLFASKGYCVIAPDIFWRQHPGFVADHTKPESIAIGVGYKHNLDHALAMDDTRVVIEALKAMPDCNGKIGAVGYCIGGTLTYMTAARIGLDAAVSYYGTQIHEFLELKNDITCPTLMHMGNRDDHVPENLASQIRDAMAENPNIAVETYSAGHAFCNTHRPKYYLPEACAAANDRTFALLERLKTSE
ncbi:dienelactone hydrolase family protein [Celeribacter halophilus]|uniref:Dienelactone hydrolase family protein n=1 Tax=Celeribacter halophilus TaxID=576117 RepID=A0AAW7Y1M0_9RHOB|nr:dienelactone hydrolase family protein [Celeribacter halophilus]MDO6459038.1 dienelactone hydrolase family protein [Celeribacter halophilus]